MLTLNEIIFKHNSDFQQITLFHFSKFPEVNDSLEEKNQDACQASKYTNKICTYFYSLLSVISQ